MPIVQTWVSDPDYPKYLAIKAQGKRAWTEYIHNALNAVDGNYELTVDLDKSQPMSEESKMVREVAEEVFGKPIKTPPGIQEPPKSIYKQAKESIKNPAEGLDFSGVDTSTTSADYVIKTPKDPLAKLHKDIMTDGFKDRPIIRSPKDAERAPITKSYSARKKK